MKPIFDHPQDVLAFCASHPEAALIVVTHVTGGTLRSKGALMAVTRDEVAGYVSNGCVDADIIARAREGQSGAFVYGEGSPFRDIILPCGGRIEISIIPEISPQEVRRGLQALEKRQSASLKLNGVAFDIVPKLRLRIAGRGAAFIALAQLAKASGLDVVLQSPDADIYPDVQHLLDPSQTPESQDDKRTAVVLLFHDHDWEPSLLNQALRGDAFYIGAMGSEKTHAARWDVLRAMNISREKFDQIKGPIGLIPAQRNASLLALSILAEIMQTAQSEGLL